MAVAQIPVNITKIISVHQFASCLLKYSLLW
jgi:hypothetical protein